MLQGTLHASAGLGQAIIATAPLAPLPIRPATTRLSARLTAGVQPREALLQFADELADPSADRVVCALLLAAASRAQKLGDLLAALADSTRDEVALRLRIETSRASVRSGVRTVLVFSLAFAVGLVVVAHSYLAPFGTNRGQLVLMSVAVLYSVGLTLMVSLARPPAAVRLLGPRGGCPVTAGIMVGVLVGLGVLGMLRGLASAPPTLDSLAATLDRPIPVRRPAEASAPRFEVLGALVIARVERTAAAGHPRWVAIGSSLAVTGETAEQLGTKMVLAGAAGLLGPPLLWALTLPLGAAVPPGWVVASALLATPICAAAPRWG